MLDHRKSKGVPKKSSTSASMSMLKPLTMWITTNCGIFLIRWEHHTTLPASLENCMQDKKQQLELEPWIFIGRTDAEAEIPILWPPDAKSWLIGNDPDAGKDWRQEEKGTTEDEMVGWHHQVDGHQFEKAPGVGARQESLACCSPWGCKELDTTEWLNSNNNNNGWGVALQTDWYKVL